MDDAVHSKKLTPLNNWIKEARASKLKPILDFVNMLHDHWYGIKAYFKKVANNAFAERVNLKIQEIKRSAKGYRNMQNFVLMIYFHLGGLDLKTHYK
jgi:transposase